MTVLIFILFAGILLTLFAEQRAAKRNRGSLSHVVHVNGIRGKSSVTRLIAAGLQGGGRRVFCKVTGTVAMTIGVDGIETPLPRRGAANIKEQLRVLAMAARAHADILVVECMAIDPALQKISQQRMLQADVGVITNVRYDHTAEMGQTLEEICDSLSQTIPQGGNLFTADSSFYNRLRENAAALGCNAHLALPKGELPEIDFPENVALALAVCRHLGVSEQAALAGMAQYKKDPFALSLHCLPSAAVVINGLSINDPQSTLMVYQRIIARKNWRQRRLILLINNRPDRGYRTQHMTQVAKQLKPAQVWLLGASQLSVGKQLAKVLPQTAVYRFSRAQQLPLEQLSAQDLVFAVGNIADEGQAFMRRIREEAQEDVL